MTTKDDLHHLVDELDAAAADELLDYAQWLREPTDVLTDDERARAEAGEAEIRCGEYVTLDELRRQLGH
jgi:hypothetical protein